jgi:hypothetical protein
MHPTDLSFGRFAQLQIGNLAPSSMLRITFRNRAMGSAAFWTRMYECQLRQNNR